MRTQPFRPAAKSYNSFYPILILFVVFLSCKKDINETASQQDVPDALSRNLLKNNKGDVNTSAAMVIRWNTAAIDVVAKLQEAMPESPVPPFIESRYYAMVNLAMHDALNNIVPYYQTYALGKDQEKSNERYKNTNPDAAVAQAAYDVIVGLYGKLNLASVVPQSVKDYVDGMLQQSLDDIKDAGPKKKGVELGHLASQAILAMRSDDGMGSAMYSVPEGTEPGQYRFTFPFDGPPFNGFYLFPGWGNVTPFGLTKGSQFRPGPPYAVNSAEYTADFNEIKSLGRYNSTTRTPDQTEIAKYWVESSPQMWNTIALKIVAQKNMGAWQVARLLALLQMSEADAYIGSFEAKLHYFTWRPVTAIRLAATDGNPNTTADPEWDVVGWNPSGEPDLRYWPTPPIPDYPSAHAVAGGAGAELIKDFFGSDNQHFSVTSTSYPSTRSFTTLSQAARENSLSRIYIGYHFRQACMVGEEQGRDIGKWIFDHYLREQ